MKNASSRKIKLITNRRFSISAAITNRRFGISAAITNRGFDIPAAIAAITNRRFASRGIPTAIETAIIRELIKARIKTSAELMVLKRKFAKQYHLSCPKNSSLLKAYHELAKAGKIKENPSLARLLRTRPIRSLSGIVNVSVLTKPYPCPGRCIFCPQESGIPKSYLSGEPAVQRAKRLNFDPYLQIQERLKALKAQGHPTGKIDLRIIGATWSAYPKKYQTWFITKCFKAANDYPKILGNKKSCLEKEQKRNEKAGQRIIGLSIETRPDWINEKEMNYPAPWGGVSLRASSFGGFHPRSKSTTPRSLGLEELRDIPADEIKRLRILGITKVELGVQSLRESVLKLVQRGHGLKEIIKATRLLKDAGFKVSYQMMLNLPGASVSKEMRMAKELFQDQRFQPDYLKIYPCAIIKNTPLYSLYQQKKYKPYSIKTLVKIIKTIKSQVPPYVRIERIIRDIPAQQIVKGPTKVSNLRQVIKAEMEKQGLKCACIRCREPGENYPENERVFLYRQDYWASQGKEIFLSFEDKSRERLYSLLRLRIPSQFFKLAENSSLPIFPVLKNAAIIRDLHTFGQALPLSQKEKTSPQHQSLGKRLMAEAERIASKEFGIKKIAVISSIGAKEYYRKLGYKLQNTYMVKQFSA